jgi:hypothetical protein
MSASFALDMPSFPLLDSCRIKREQGKDTAFTTVVGPQDVDDILDR